MAAFIQKKIVTQKTIGESLKNVREGMGYALDEMAERTNIRSFYLRALESAEYDKIPGEVYIKSFLRVYSKELGLSETEIIERYENERVVWEGTMKSRMKKLPDMPWWKKCMFFISHPRTIRITLSVVIVAAVLGYVVYQLYAIITPPDLAVRSPANELITADRAVRVHGTTEPNAFVRINSESIHVAEDGGFEKFIDLQEGLNLIRIEASKKYSRVRVELRHVLVEAVEKPLIDRVEEQVERGE